MKKEIYDELLGVSCHELFHHWNIKTIRPKEMLPYDYTKENYSTLGFVCEGVTTYYGDYILYRSGVFSDDDYFDCFNAQLKKHCDNFGRFNYSLAESSFDTWLDGYHKGVPHRKVSIYTEGCIVAFITDINIRKHTKNQKNLDDVVRTLYNDYGKQNKGYTDNDYRNIVNINANADLNWIFDNHVYDSKIVIEPLKDALHYLGLELSIMPVKNIYEALLGFKTVLENGKYVVSNIYPDSECEKKGLMLNDKIVSINGYEIKQDLNEWITYYSDDDISMEVINSGQLRQIICRNSKNIYYKNYAVLKQFYATAEQKENFKNWSGRYF
jgi:predicted metalloprotease with PDZ domain